MKRRIGFFIILAMVAICACALADVEINETNFPDAAFRNCVSQFDLNGDGKLSDEEISAVSMIKIGIYGEVPAEERISDLTGIAYFSALKSLNCDGHPLTSLDVSQNTMLEQLECSYTFQLTSVNVSGCQNLRELILGYNSLADLDISHNPALTYLYVSSNQLMSLDVSNNPALERLYCAGNLLNTLDVRNNPKLTELECVTNDLTELDVRYNTKLIRIRCLENRLTSLDLTNNKLLEYLDCSWNQLTGLDLRNNPAIKWLDCHQNSIQNLNVVSVPVLNELASTVEPVEIRTWNDQYTQWGDDPRNRTYLSTPIGTEVVFDATAVPDPDEEEEAGNGVTINVQHFPDETFREYISSFDTDGNGVLSDEEIAKVNRITCPMRGIYSLKGIEYFTSLKILQCGYNLITELDVSRNTLLEELECHGGYKKLTSLDLSHNTALRTLDCYDHNLTELDLSHNPALQSVDCSCNDLTGLNLGTNSSMTKLNCSSNQLTSLDVSRNKALSVLICHGNQMETLDIRQCPVLCGFMEESERTSFIQDDKIQYDYFQDPSVFSFDAITTVTGVYESKPLIDLAKIPINEKNFPDPVFRSLVAENFDTDGNGALNEMEIQAAYEITCSGKGITSLKGIEHFTSLWYLYCSSNQLTSLDLSHNTNLRQLVCFSNQLTDLNLSGCEFFEILSCEGNQLTSLDLSHNLQLVSILCDDNLLTELDLSYHTALTQMHAQNNRLVSLDVTGCTKLSSFYCTGNSLTELDVSTNSSLEDFQCYKNQLTCLDVSHHLLLKGLSCEENKLQELIITDTPRLEELWCYSNQLNSLDVSQNKALNTLICYGNKLKQLDVSHNPKLEVLRCRKNLLTHLDVSKCGTINRLVKETERVDFGYEEFGFGVGWIDESGEYKGSLFADENVEVLTGPDLVPVSSIRLDKSSVQLTISQEDTNPTIRLTATIEPANASDPGTVWMSDHPDIATVNPDGVVTAVGAGQCTITCTAEDGSDVSASCTVAVESSVHEHSGEWTLTDHQISGGKVTDTYERICTVCGEKETRTEESDFIRLPGDVNEDGEVDGRDVIRLMKYLAAEEDPETGELIKINEDNADVDGSRTVDEKDLLLMIRYLGGEDVELKPGAVSGNG